MNHFDVSYFSKLSTDIFIHISVLHWKLHFRENSVNSVLL